jgi:hypothetical protein
MNAESAHREGKLTPTHSFASLPPASISAPLSAISPASSSSSINKQDGAIPSKFSYESDYKQESKVHDTEKLTSHSALPANNEESDVEDDVDFDDNDDSFADSKEVETFKTENKTEKTEDKQSKYEPQAKEDRTMKDERTMDLHEEKAVYEPEQESDDDDDEKSFDAPEVDDIEEEDIEVEAGSESSASFSLEYGYVEDQPASKGNDESRNRSPSPDKKDDNKDDNKDDKKEQPAPGVTAGKSTILSVEGSLSEDGDYSLPDVPRSDTVGVQKLAQVHSTFTALVYCVIY